MELLSTIKTILDIAKHFKDFNKEDKSKKNDLSPITNKLLNVENELEQLKAEKHLIGKQNLNQIQVKLKTVFNSHGIDDNLIAEFVSQYIDNTIQIPISEKENLHYIFDKFSDKNIDFIFDFFGLNKGWLFGKEYLYPYRTQTRHVTGLMNFIIDRYKNNEKLQGYVLRKNNLNKDDDEFQPIDIIFRVPVGVLYGFNKTIYKYYIMNTDWKWNYWKTRYYAKSIFYLSDKYRRFFDLNGVHITNEKDFESATSLNFCPHKIIENNTKPYGWYPYDYITDKSFNYSEEIDETTSVIEYIKEEKYIENFEEKTTLKALFGK
ncbi:hypothetical protein ACE1MK_09170 [Tenacibaculum maritimum]|uniref:hypothetical protein n=1 Tax=Tenacibaculum maritimum TaxID=107401 RepID=UPI00132F86E1|nr:hypothetical protein [Tenacibaculum maritimum]